MTIPTRQRGAGPSALPAAMLALLAALAVLAGWPSTGLGAAGVSQGGESGPGAQRAGQGVSHDLAGTHAPEARADSLHAEYDRLVQSYVEGFGVDYAAWAATDSDVRSLDEYIRGLSALDPSGWERADGLAYWINMYNALTLQLILENYPLDSIKDLGGFLRRSPWKREVISVAGDRLTLDEIQNEFIRPIYEDPRIHFAINCASMGCPPLSDQAYRSGTISRQLDDACVRALNHERWVRVDSDGIRVTKIFDWYEEDFAVQGGSVRTFIDRYRATRLPEGNIEHLSYDWSLNAAESDPSSRKR